MADCNILMFIVFCLSSFLLVACIPCSINDDDCLKKIFTDTNQRIKDGIPDIGVPGLDPLELTNINLDIPNAGTFQIKESVVEGLADCDYVHGRIILEDGNGTITLKCNIVSKGICNAIIKEPSKYRIPVDNSIVCDGPFEVKLYNASFTNTFQFVVVKDVEGVIYMQYANGHIVYNINEYGHKVEFSLSGVFANNKDVSKLTNKALNDNWKNVSMLFVEAFLLNSTKNIFEPYIKYFGLTPTRNIISDEIEKYITRDENKDFQRRQRCSVNDTECHFNFIVKAKKVISKGIPELNLSKSGILILKNLTVKLPDLMDFTLLDGTLDGADKCSLKSARFNLEAKMFTIEQHCNLIIRGLYNAVLYAGATLSTFGGQSVRAQGNTQVTLFKIPLFADYPFEFGSEDGVKHISFKQASIRYDFKEPGHKMSFVLDGVKLGTFDISEVAMNILNENWQFFAPDFAPTFVYEANRLINEPLIKYLSYLPVNEYLAIVE